MTATHYWAITPGDAERPWRAEAHGVPLSNGTPEIQASTFESVEANLRATEERLGWGTGRLVRADNTEIEWRRA